MSILSVIETWLKPSPAAMPNSLIDTGTFADGITYLIRNERLVEARRENLRTSYGRDLRAAQRISGQQQVSF
ncbi:exo-alpha-sialidase [Rhizobium sp. SSA_523]|uniref:exo-alpha-sialidase n=1 Tax=Rhizobium sp. SSA_523 TaxID=2952477 RepID=UPI0020900DE8|nr:exo-alpha-sialidase [Rhizobium sp. SSA_523]MCO5730353.1 exo-alpha-sialidase [Rhizobium sp. SSA_523]WKC25400.1 exo-alpha-sialidase [Rhizobium sp. SSA_523]